MSIRLVTGYTGENHITAQDDRSRNMGLVGGFGPVGRNVFVLSGVGTSDPKPFKASMVGGNTLRILPGEGMLQGLHFRIPYGSYEDLTIENGTQGMNRVDLVVAHYAKDSSTNVETVELKVVKGTATSGTPSYPAVETGYLYEGATSTDAVMYRVWLAGTSVVEIESTMVEVDSLDTIGSVTFGNQTAINELEDLVGNSTISGSGRSTITALLGNTRISAISGTVTAALVAIKNALDSAVARLTTAEGKLANIGTVHTGYLASTTSVQNTTATALTDCNVALTAGTWLVIGKVTYQGGTAGTYRQARLGSTATGNEYGIVQFDAASNNRSAMVSAVLTLTTGRTVYLSTEHGNGSATPVAGGRWNTFIQAVRIA